MRLRIRAAAAGCAVAALAGCVTYAPTPLPATPERGVVRVMFTSEGAAALATRLGGAVTGVEGSVVRRSADTLIVDVQHLVTSADVQFAWQGQLPIASNYVRGVESRRFSASRTALVVGGAVAIGVALVAIIKARGESQDIPSTGGGIPSLSVGKP